MSKVLFYTNHYSLLAISYSLSKANLRFGDISCSFEIGQ